MKTFQLCFVVLTIGSLVGCAPETGSRNLRIQTGLNVRNDSLKLDSIFNYSIGTGVATCVQKEIQAVYQVGGDKGEIRSFPVMLRSELFPVALVMGNTVTGVSATATDWLNNHSELMSAIDLPPINDISAVGLFGAFYVPRDINNDGICDSLDATSNAINSFSLYGHRDIAANVRGDIPVKIWALQTAPSAVYTPPTFSASGVVTSTGSFHCDDLNNERSCSFHDVVEIANRIPGTAAGFYIKEVDHLFSPDNQTAVHHQVYSVTPQAIYLSTVDRVRLKYRYSGSDYAVDLPELKKGDYCVPEDTNCTGSIINGVPTATNPDFSVKSF